MLLKVIKRSLGLRDCKVVCEDLDREVTGYFDFSRAYTQEKFCFGVVRLA